ncbi:MAG: OmpH family outer membrane protein [Bacteroidales bacterium]|nr:OmpH family outer membrane protein [Bacteroidales bacterium]
MKKIFFIVAMAFLATTAFAQQKFAHVNFAELVQLAPEADQAREAISASSKEAQETYQAMVEEFNSKYQQYQQKASTWTQAIRESKEKELTEIQQRIQEFQQSIQLELQQQEQQLMAPIYDKANEVVKNIAKQGGYIYVFDKNTALYVDESQSKDITPEARKALNIPADRTLEALQAELAAQAQQAQGAE